MATDMPTSWDLDNSDDETTADAPTYWDPDKSDDEIKVSMLTKPKPPSPAPTRPFRKSNIHICHSSLTIHPQAFSAPPPAHPSPASSKTFEPFKHAFGDVSEKGLFFVPFKLVKNYPYMYVGKSNQAQVRIKIISQSTTRPLLTSVAGR
jgi:hypothetical protein